MDDSNPLLAPDVAPNVAPQVAAPSTATSQVPASQAPASSNERSQDAGASTARWWFTGLVLLTLVAAAPYLIGPFVYQMRYNLQKADADVSIEALQGIEPQLTHFELASRMIAKRVEPSVVSIFRPGTRGREGQGSGVIVDPAGYIVTNFHVINGAPSISVHLTDGRVAPAKIIGADDITDLAVLKIDLPNLIAAEWGDSDDLQVGDLVWALGSPFGLEHSFTFGIVSAKSRRSGSSISRNLYQEYLQTDAAVNPGNSGGPLINIEGKVIGINAAIFGQSYQGISFAIPSAVAKAQYDVLKIKGWVERAYLGIKPVKVPQNVQERLGLEIGQGVYVDHVEPRAPAERAGIHMGDVILQWNDFIATDPTLLSRAIAATKVGSKAKVRLVRVEGEDEAESKPSELEFNVEVERHPDSRPTRNSRD
jgi:serine protease Do